MSRAELYKKFDSSMLHGAEIGVGDGTNAVTILESFPDMHLLLVDPWSGNPRRSARYYRIVERKARRKLESYHNRVAIVKQKSERVALAVAARSLDFVYIDGDHSYDAVGKDLVLWHRRTKDGGIISGHDYVDTKKHGVKAAVDAYTSYHSIKLNVYEDNWWWRVRW